MSHTLNNITMLVALSEVAKDSASLQRYILANAEHMKAEGRPFKEYPELFTESLVSEQLHVLRKSDMGEQVGRKIHSTPIHEELEHAGINPDLMSNTELREMQVAKLFVNEFRSDATFKEVLWNARDHINSHLVSGQGSDNIKNSGRHLPASILYSACLGNKGYGIGMREPDEYHLSDAMSKNPRIQSLFDKLIDANAMYFESQGLGARVSDAWARVAEHARDIIEDARQNPTRAMTKGLGAFGLTASLFAFMHLQMGPSTPDTSHMQELSYAPNAHSYSVVVPVNDGDTASQIVENTLKAIDVKPTPQNIDSMLKANNLGDDIIRNTIISVKLPDVMLTEEHLYNLSKQGMSVAQAGKPAMTAFMNNLEEKRGNEHAGPSM